LITTLDESEYQLASDTLNFPNEGKFVTGGSDTSWVYTCEGMCLIELWVEDSITANLIVLPLRLKSLIRNLDYM
jgi:hypothetical protein